ncbi:hypothetical protein VP1G_10789 [Cytospora mali]|uniref:Uncharacterized protein n=1 Tax=Cytospora mali TaxID=578113 RepID=A0A194UWV1_CYTMA|nr:hypothetical protein VP1G_10789 [Valsa mali var. pyri (nom. inval.)]
MPVLEEMEIRLGRYGPPSECLDTLTCHYKFKPTGIQFGAQKLRNGVRASLDIFGIPMEAATEVVWTSSVEKVHGVPLQVTWH